MDRGDNCSGGVMQRLLVSSIFLAVFGIFSIILPSCLHAENASAEDIRIGAIVDLTGPHATRGQLNLRGMEDYFRYINETASGIAGRKIVLAIVDGGTEGLQMRSKIWKSYVFQKRLIWRPFTMPVSLKRPGPFL